MPDVYPNVFVGFTEQANEAPDGSGGTVADADFINSITDTVYQLEYMVGLASDVAGTTGHEARIKRLEAKNAVKITYSNVAPASPAMTDIWVDTTTSPWTWKSWNASSWVRMGAEAVAITGKDIDPTTPTNGQVLTYNSTSGKANWATPAGAVGFTNPMTTAGDIIIGGASGAAARLPLGTTGQILLVTTTGIQWQTPTFMPAPSGAAQGDVIYYNGTNWVSLHPGTSGQFLKTNGPSDNPVWGDLPSSPPGSAIAAPSGAVLGSLLYYDGTNWVQLSPGTSGQFLKTNGSASPSWASPTSTGMTNPMTNLGDIIISSDGSGTPARLPLGSSGQVLKVVGTAPAWAAEIGFANPMTTQDDVILGGASGAPGRLAKGTDGQILKVDPSDHHVKWLADTGFANPMTATGDLILGGSSGAPGRLAIGTTNQVLAVIGGTAVWSALTAIGALTNPMTASQDVIVGGTSGAPARLPVGSLGQVLSLVAGIGGVPTVGWATPASGGGGGGLTNPMTTIGDLILGGASGIAVRLPKGANNQILTVDGSGNVGWANAAAGFTNPMTTQDDIIVADSGGTAVRLAKGSDGYILRVDPSDHHTKWMQFPDHVHQGGAGDGGLLNGSALSTHLDFSGTTTPSTPLDNHGRLYAKLVASKAHPHWLDEDGTETDLLSGGGSAIAVADEGSTISSGIAGINFVGAGVSAAMSGSTAVVTIPGGSGAGLGWEIDAYGNRVAPMLASSLLTPIGIGNSGALTGVDSEASDFTNGLYLQKTGNNSNMAFWPVASGLSAVDHTLTACVVVQGNRADNNVAGLGWIPTGTTPATMTAITWGIDLGATSQGLLGSKWNTMQNNYNGNYFSEDMRECRVWLRIQQVGLHRNLEWSLDGEHWIRPRGAASYGADIPTTDFMTTDRVGFFINTANGGAGVQMTVLSASYTTP